ncbi:MAG: chromosome segregation protein SMC [Coriobacteriales bacterium]|jgi:chromosome segregation protein|nr:chromosome segregation protein SMC [Coriobacteriales bacterium]
MYLKSLTIKGFKSFADRSSISFEPGISVIVGPNGSGKSNISEAIMWVLGEKNPRNLRVQSLEELIFSGSSARQAVSVAEVDLILDNSDKTLAIEFDQVAISRRMYRSGESEYFINKTPSRRRDIIDILYDSGIGGAANSIIGQGNLTAILESRPEDRHALLEDAAGILKHKKRKEAASRKLDRMDATLERVNDIIRVVESQLRPLERQAKRAEEHAQASGELQSIDLALAVDELRALQAEWDQLSHQLKEIDAEAELASFRLGERESELAKRQLALEEKGLFVGDINEQRIRILSVIQRLDAGMLLLEEKGKNLVSRLSDLRATIHNSKTRLEAAKTEHQQLGSEFAAGEGSVAAIYTELAELSRESEALTRRRRQAEENYNSLATKLRSQESALAATHTNLGKANDSVASLDVEEGLLHERAQEIDQELEVNREAVREYEQRTEEQQRELLKLRRTNDLATAEVAKFIRLLDERKRRLDAKMSEVSDHRAQLSGLKEIERAQEAASPALNWAIENKAKLKGIVGPLSGSIRVKTETALPFGLATTDVENIVERLLGSDYFGLLVNDNDTAARLAQRLQHEKQDSDDQSVLSSAALSILPIDGMRYSAEKSTRGKRLIDYLDYPSAQHGTVSALLGDVYVVKDVLEAQKFHLLDRIGVRFITPAGQIVWPNGKLTLGFMYGDVAGVLERRRAIERLNDEVELELSAISEIELEVSNAEQNLEQAQENSLHVAGQLAQLQGQSQAQTAELERLQQLGAQLGFRHEEHVRRLADVTRRRDTAAPLTKEYEQRIAGLEQEIQDLKIELEQASQTLLAATEEQNTVAERLTEVKVKLEAGKASQTHLKGRLLQLDTTIRGLENTLEVSEQTAASLGLVRLRIDPLYKLYQELSGGAGTWAERLHDQALLEQTDSTNLRKVISEANQAVDDARSALAAINERRTEVLVEQGKLESRVQNAMQRIVNQHQTSLEAALELPPIENRHLAEERANRLRSKIANLGAINQVAMEEYDALKARRDYMTEQIADLIEARKSLTKISKALDRKMHNQFLEVFDAVNTSFQEIIAILFPGGRGELILTQGQMPEENGVEVSAQPQGKRIQKLSMMSGGEKSLVALALMFAVYSVRSVPFYVLDEVEAALDDTNLMRLLEYLDHLRGTTQLILVSHQRRTMECADVLYGVTMQAAGVSVLVSQRLDQALGYASRDKGENVGPDVDGTA